MKLFILCLLVNLTFSANSSEKNKKEKLNYIAGFKYSQRSNSIDGRQNIWDVRLYPNGKFTWLGNHLGTTEACSKQAGEIIQILSKEDHEKVVLLAYENVKEQKATPMKPQNKHIEMKSGASLGVEYKKDYVLSSINKPHSSKMKAFKEEMKKVLNNIIDKKNSKARVLEISSTLSKEVIIAQIKNVGVLPTRLITSKDASGTFYLKSKNRKHPVEFINSKGANLDKVIQPGKSYKIYLKAEGIKLDAKWKLVFQNQFNRSIKNKVKAINVTLCDNLTVESL